MNPPAADTTATTTFVVHFWREWTGTEPRWRGRVEHVQSGQRTDFLDVEGLLGFLVRFGIGAAVLPASRLEDHRAEKTHAAGVGDWP